MRPESTHSVAVLNGPNMNWLGRREPEIYGSTTLADLEAALVAHGKDLGWHVECYQNNSEGALVDAIYAFASRGIRDFIVNAGAYTHTSVALRDALSSVQARFIEVHISNVYQREAFRRQSYLSDIAQGVIAGCGTHGYTLALDWFAHQDGAGSADADAMRS